MSILFIVVRLDPSSTCRKRETFFLLSLRMYVYRCERGYFSCAVVAVAVNVLMFVLHHTFHSLFGIMIHFNALCAVENR